MPSSDVLAQLLQDENQGVAPVLHSWLPQRLPGRQQTPSRLLRQQLVPVLHVIDVQLQWRRSLRSLLAHRRQPYVFRLPQLDYAATPVETLGQEHAQLQPCLPSLLTMPLTRQMLLLPSLHSAAPPIQQSELTLSFAPH